MTASVVQLRLIKSLDTAEKLRLPVSMALNEKGKEFVISRYEDEAWDFWPYIKIENLPANKKRINWRMKLPDGLLLTDPQHRALLESAKDFIWSLYAEPVEGRKRPTLQAIRSKYKNMIPLLRWMVGQGMSRFAQLEGRTMNYVPIAKIGEKGQKLGSQTVYMSLSILEELYLQRNKLSDAITRHPWPYESANSLAGRDTARGNRKPKTELIPESVVQKLAPIAIDYVENMAKKLLDIRDAGEAVVNAALERGVGNQVTLRDYRLHAINDMFSQGAKQLNVELLFLRTACYIVIDLFSGIRDSEMLALSRDCVARTKDENGVDLTWVHGSIYKTDDPAHKWLVPPIVVTAIEVMERYAEPFKKKLLAEGEQIKQQLKGRVSNSKKEKFLKRLDIIQHQLNNLFLSYSKMQDSVQVVSSTSMNRYLKKFCSDFNITDEDCEIWSLSAHQFRRTYAYFVASAELGDIQMLREHFGHWALDMTLVYTDGADENFVMDSDLLDNVISEKDARQKEVLRSYLVDDIPMANGDVMLSDLRHQIKTAKNQEELLEQVSKGVVLNGTGHSWCIGNAKGTGCGGLCVFEADMCVDCNYGMIGEEFLPVWKEIKGQQALALKAPDLGIPGKARAKRIHDKACEVVDKLEGVA